MNETINAAGDVAAQVKDAVRMALLEERVSDHGARIKALEAFRWWLLGGVAAGAVGSWLSVLVAFATQGHH